METLLDAAACVADLSDLIVLLVGDGSEKTKLVELARTRRLSNVRFADPIPPETVLPLHRRAATTWPAGAGSRPPAGSSATW
jgi:hypothetical protein